MISAKTRTKVLDVARELKYRHNLHARALRMGKSHLIGLMMFDLEYKIALAKLEAIDNAVWTRGYRSLIRNAGGHGDMIPQLIAEYAGGAVEGLIIVQPHAEISGRALDMLSGSDIPIVTLEPIDGASLDCVTVDRKYGAYIAIKHLLELGHRRIGMLHSHHSVLHLVPRLLGYREALAEYSLPVDDSLLIESRVGYEGGYSAAYELIARKTGVTAIFCNNDEIAIGAMKAITNMGLRIPEDIAVIGFDNIEAGAYAPVTLTTIVQPVEEVALRSVELLFDRLQNPDSGDSTSLVRLKPSLVIRESCGGLKKHSVGTEKCSAFCS